MNFEKLDDYLDSLGEKGIPACDCLVYLNHKPVFRHMQGFSDGQKTKPTSERDLYWLYSATKVITCTSAMQLVEKALLRLNDPVSRYLPSYGNLQVRHGGGVEPAERAMTIRDLFTMCGGLDYNVGILSIRKVLEHTGNKATTREIVDAIACEPLSFEPSTHFQYSLCHDVLGAVIEVVSGKSLGQYMKEHIFEPLGMADTGFGLNAEQQSRRAALYAYDEATGKSKEISPVNEYQLSDRYESGGAGLTSSVNDYILFADALCNEGIGVTGKQILSKGSIDLMRKDQLIGECVADFALLGKIGYSYGLGVRTLVDKAISHSRSPIGEFGWDGAAGAYVMIDPTNHLALFYAQHVLNCHHAFQEIHPAIRNMVYDALEIED
jgi:Beta-lactamase class C and other penicillin binding proteins